MVLMISTYMKRLFIAVKVNPEDELLRIISSLKAALGAENIKWVDPVNIHLTLSFLGDTEEKHIRDINSMLTDKCSGFGEFDFNLTGTGVFKNFRDPRVLWAGIQSSGKLLMLNNIIAAGLKENGFEIEGRQFKPHLTLGRVKSVRDTENLKTVLERDKDNQFQIVHVSEVILFESILTQTGPIYKPLGKHPL
jgi:RNA 2',3'-cyclic 3'-phosphodiesterase